MVDSAKRWAPSLQTYCLRECSLSCPGGVVSVWRHAGTRCRRACLGCESRGSSSDFWDSQLPFSKRCSPDCTLCCTSTNMCDLVSLPARSMKVTWCAADFVRDLWNHAWMLRTLAGHMSTCRASCSSQVRICGVALFRFQFWVELFIPPLSCLMPGLANGFLLSSLCLTAFQCELLKLLGAPLLLYLWLITYSSPWHTDLTAILLLAAERVGDSLQDPLHRLRCTTSPWSPIGGQPGPCLRWQEQVNFVRKSPVGVSGCTGPKHVRIWWPLISLLATAKSSVTASVAWLHNKIWHCIMCGTHVDRAMLQVIPACAFWGKLGYKSPSPEIAAAAHVLAPAAGSLQSWWGPILIWRTMSIKTSYPRGGLRKLGLEGYEWTCAGTRLSCSWGEDSSNVYWTLCGCDQTDW